MTTVLPARSSKQINWQFVMTVAIVAGIVLFMLGIFLVPFLTSVVTGGVRNVGGGFKEVDLKAMSLFTFDQVNGTINDIPPKWRSLDGQKVILEGEMWDARSAGPQVKTFQLCYSIAKCCFQGPPQVQHFVDSVATPDAAIDYYSGLVRVTGILHVKVKQGEGKVASVYQLDVQSLEPVQ
jgi:hypothetical protein